MYKIWMHFDIQRTLVALHVGMAVLAFTIHFLLLSTDRYNWMDQPMGAPASASAAVELLDPPALS